MPVPGQLQLAAVGELFAAGAHAHSRPHGGMLSTQKHARQGRLGTSPAMPWSRGTEQQTPRCPCLRRGAAGWAHILPLTFPAKMLGPTTVAVLALVVVKEAVATVRVTPGAVVTLRLWGQQGAAAAWRQC